MKNIYLSLSLLIGVAGFAQGENDNWYFGEHAALNFSTNPPTILLNNQMNQFEGVASVSNANGQLLFYTDGSTIWGANHVPMPNGSSLTGNYSTAQAALIVPYPGNSKLYYVFTVPNLDQPTSGPPSYSIVDITLNGGFGDIVTNQKNIPLLDENGNQFAVGSEAITVAMNSNENGFWVLHPRNNTLYSYPVSTLGFTNVPVTSTMTLQDGLITRISQVKVSPDNSRIAIASISTQRRFRIYNFNNATGQVDTSFEFAVDNASIYSAEFSANNNVVYANQPSGTIYVFDLVNLQFRNINQNVSFGTLQRSKFNDIYVPHGNFNSLTGGSPYLSRIINADDYANSSLDLNYVTLSPGLSHLGLPQRVVTLPAPGCPNNITLNTPETNTTFVYKYATGITATNQYQTNEGQDITFKAGDFIMLQPNTEIKSGSVFLAEIETCKPIVPKSAKDRVVNTPVKFTLDFSAESSLQVYPNPAKDIVNLVMENYSLNNVSIIGIDGKTLINQKVNQPGSNYSLDISSLPSGIYIINIATTNGKTVTKKLIVE